MFAQAAQAMGHSVVVLQPGDTCPAAEFANVHHAANYDDTHALDALADQCVAASFEFESVPASSIEHLQSRIPVRPSAVALEISQSRSKEKAFAQQHAPESPPVPHVSITDAAQISEALERLGPSCLLKTDSLGYDGKGQVAVTPATDPVAACRALGGAPGILEARVDFACEISAILARTADGRTACHDVVENRHVDGILDTTIGNDRDAEPAGVLCHLVNGRGLGPTHRKHFLHTNKCCVISSNIN